jgi:hypothetical protein
MDIRASPLNAKMIWCTMELEANNGEVLRLQERAKISMQKESEIEEGRPSLLLTSLARCNFVNKTKERCFPGV